MPALALVLTYGGGPPVIAAYEGFGARRCIPVYNACDPTTHHPVPADDRFRADLSFLGNRLPDREARVEQFFLEPAARLPNRSFLIGGNGWETKGLPQNVRHIGHVYTRDHNAFNTSPLAVLNIARDSMATTGFSPATRVFEAAGAGACLITDAWVGLELFLQEGEEVLVARDGRDVAEPGEAPPPGPRRPVPAHASSPMPGSGSSSSSRRARRCSSPGTAAMSRSTSRPSRRNAPRRSERQRARAPPPRPPPRRPAPRG